MAFSLMTACLVAALVGIGAGVAGQSPDASAVQAAAPMEGRYAVVSQAGGAVWDFLPDGRLVIVGPVDLVAEGEWMPVADPGAFDASVDIELTGQALSVMGTFAPDGQRVALHVVASEARRPGDGATWPAESRLVGERIGMAEEEASPTPRADECLRPTWTDAATVDWDPCDEGLGTNLEGPGASAAPGVVVQTTASPH
jgi:hypothetical protein